MQNSRAGVVFARALPHRGVERLPRRPIDAKQSDYSGGRGDYAGKQYRFPPPSPRLAPLVPDIVLAAVRRLGSANFKLKPTTGLVEPLVEPRGRPWLDKGSKVKPLRSKTADRRLENIEVIRIYPLRPQQRVL
jgi:hypothetical protein